MAYSSDNSNHLNSLIVEFDIQRQTYKERSISDFESIHPHKNKIYWIHFNLNELNNFQAIANHLSLPERMVKLCLQKDSIPLLIDSEESITLQIECLFDNNEFNNLENFGSLMLHLTDYYCFTASTSQIPALIEFKNHYAQALKYAKTPCFILFLILNNVVNEYGKLFFNFEVLVDKMDLQVRSIHQNIYSEVLQVKNQMMKIRRNALAIREMLMRMSVRKISVISEYCRLSLNNLMNQSDMIFHEADSVRDRLNGLLDQIDNALMQKMNETMRVLTAFAAIFLPLTLITGIYGMNFHKMPELEWEYGYYWALGLIVLCGIVLLYIFKKKKWF